MNIKYTKIGITKVIRLCLVLISTELSHAQNMQLVWSDEFDNSVDFSIWDYGVGPSNDNVHYYTNRGQNLKIVDSVLNIYGRFQEMPQLYRVKILIRF
jgi:hypothetical protein